MSEKLGGWEKKLFKSAPYLRPSPIICVRITQNAEFWYSKPQSPENEREKKDIAIPKKVERITQTLFIFTFHIEP